MLKKLLKKSLLIASIAITGVVGFLFSSDKITNNNPSTTVLREPIFSIDTAYADGAGGDCCCGCDYVPTDPAAAWVYIDAQPQ